MAESEDKLAAQGDLRHVLTTEGRDEVVASPNPPAATAIEAGVHVAPNLMDVALGRVETSEEKKQARQTRDLNEVVRKILVVGLALSALLMLVGLVENAVVRRAPPAAEPNLGRVLADALALQPTGFMTLGLLVLMATPILRVAGSIVTFAAERDWRFVGITALVFGIVISSILLGGG